jgi:hypothetical protein
MTGYMQLNDYFNARAISAPSFSKHHKSESIMIMIFTLFSTLTPKVISRRNPQVAIICRFGSQVGEILRYI